MINLWSFEQAEKAFAMAPRYCKECERNLAEFAGYCGPCYDALIDQQIGEDK
jgi:hypothetical protein